MYKFYKIILFFIIIILSVATCKPEANRPALEISQGYVPDSNTALEIAQIIFVRVYGSKVLDKRPFVVTLKNGVWVVDGTLKKGLDGGVPHIEIQKSDGKILYLIHGK